MIELLRAGILPRVVLAIVAALMVRDAMQLLTGRRTWIRGHQSPFPVSGWFGRFGGVVLLFVAMILMLMVSFWGR